ncbi:MAG: ATP-binding protein [Myxococcota bacterium]
MNGGSPNTPDRLDAASELQLLRDRLRDFERAERLAGFGTWRWNIHTGRVRWSLGLFRLLHMSPEVEPTPELFFECIHPDDRARVRRAVQRALDSFPAEPMHYRLTVGDGRTLHVRGAAEPFYDERGQVDGYRGTVLDVSEKHELETMLRQSQKLESLGQLAAGLAHDFNNLLTVMTVNVDMLRETHPAEELEEIAESVGLAARVTGQLLTFSRQSEPVMEELDLRDALASIEPLVRRLLPASVRVSLELSEDECRVKADRSQLQQIILNLAINAADAMPKGGELRLAAELTVRDSDEFAVIVVADTGPGIDLETQKRIFDPFFTTKEAGRGTGLGLSTVANIAEFLDAKIEVDSEVGEGTTFRVLLPSNERITPEAADAITAELAMDALDGVHVAIVEGQLDVRRILERTFDDAGAWVRSFGGPDDLYRAIDDDRLAVDLLVTDPHEQSHSGLEIHQNIKVRLPDCRAVYVSGYSRDPEPGLESQAGWVVKPFTRAQLLEEAVRVLSQTE